MRAEPRRSWALLALAALLYVALRGLILHTSFESVALPMYELYPMGTMAELRLRGIDFPLRYFYDNAAGQILMGFLTVPVFAVFGSTYLALKLLPAALGLGTMLLVWKLLDRHASRRAADIAALLFAVGPPTLTKYSLINSGNHFENLFFTTLAILLAYGWFASEAKARGGLFAYAFACGFALFVFLGALIPVGILFGMHAGLRGLRRTLRDLPVLLCGFLLGIAPLVIVNAATSGRGLGFLDAKFGIEARGSGPGVLSRAAEFLGPGLAQAPVFEPFAGLSREILTALFLTAFVAAWLAAVPSVAASLAAFVRGLFGPARAAEDEVAAFERAKLVPFTIYVPLAALAYGLSNFRIGGHTPPVEAAGYRYYLPTLLCALILIAVCADRWLARGERDPTRARRELRGLGIFVALAAVAYVFFELGTPELSMVVVGAAGAWWSFREGAGRMAGFGLLTLVAVPCASGLAIVDWTFAAPNVGHRLEGYNLAQVARALVSSRNAVPDDEIVRRVQALTDPNLSAPMVTALGFNLGTRAVERAAREAVVDWRIDSADMLERWPVEWHGHVVRGLGHALRWRIHIARGPVEGVVDLAARVRLPPDGTFSEQLWEGLASPGVALPMPWESGRILDENDALLAQRGAELPGLARGHGALCERMRWRHIPAEMERCSLSAQRARGTPYERAWQTGVAVGTFWIW